MSGIIAFDDLFPLKPNPTALDRVFGFDAEDGKSRAFSTQSILDLIDETPVTWGEITGKPSTFAPAAHSFGSHSNVSSGVDSAPDGTYVKKVAGQYQAVAVDFYGVSNPPPPDPSIDDAVRLIDGTKTAQWDQAYGWGNHAGQYRPIAWVPSWGEVTGKPSTFAPAAHTLASHSDAGALAAATNGQLVRKGATAFEAFTPNYYSPSSPPPPDASVPDFVRELTLGQFAGYDEKLLEWVGMPNGAIPAILGGVPVSSEIVGTFTENPYDPIEETEDYEAWVTELLYLTSAKRIKAPDAVDEDDLATLGQIPVLFDEDLEAIANSAPHSALNPFATIADLFTVSGTPAEGNVVTWSSGAPAWAAPSGGGSSLWTDQSTYISRDGKVVIGTATQVSSVNQTLEIKTRRANNLSNQNQIAIYSLEDDPILLIGSVNTLNYPTWGGSGFAIGVSQSGSNYATFVHRSGLTAAFGGDAFRFENASGDMILKGTHTRIVSFGNPTLSIGTTSTNLGIRQRAGTSGNGGSQFLLEDSNGTMNFNVDNIGRAQFRNTLTINSGGFGVNMTANSLGINIKGTNDGADAFRLYTQGDVLVTFYRRTLGWVFRAFGTNDNQVIMNLQDVAGTERFKYLANGRAFFYSLPTTAPASGTYEVYVDASGYLKLAI